MDESLTVRVLERVSHLRSDVGGVTHGQPTALVDHAPERCSLDELHDDVGGAGVVAGVVCRHDPGVRELRGGDGFVTEADAQGFVDGELRQQKLDRDAARQQRVLGDPHRGHAAARELAVEAVAPSEDASGRGMLRHVPRR